MLHIPATTVRGAYTEALRCFRKQLLVARYSPSTVRTYDYMFREFLSYQFPIPLYHISKQHILDYQLALVETKKVSRSYQNQSINALKFYWEQVLGHDRQLFELSRPKKIEKLPSVLSLDEVQRILRATPGLKHCKTSAKSGQLS